MLGFSERTGPGEQATDISVELQVRQNRGSFYTQKALTLLQADVRSEKLPMIGRAVP